MKQNFLDRFASLEELTLIIPPYYFLKLYDTSATGNIVILHSGPVIDGNKCCSCFNAAKIFLEFGFSLLSFYGQLSVNTIRECLVVRLAAEAPPAASFPAVKFVFFYLYTNSTPSFALLLAVGIALSV